MLTRPYAATSLWNTPIPATATYTPTSTFAGELGKVDAEKTSVPVWFSAPTDPQLTFTVNRNRVMKVLGPAKLTTQPKPDRSVIIVDLAAGTSSEFWHVTRTGATTFTAEAGTQTSLDGTGFGSFDDAGARTRAGIRASGASFLGGLMTGENFASGRIDHALAMSFTNGDLVAAYIPPAVDIDANARSVYSGTLPMGTHVAIPPGTPRPATLSPAGAMVWDALVTYGGFALDRAPKVTLDADARTVSEADVDPLRNTARPGGSDLQKILPYLQVVTLG